MKIQYASDLHLELSDNSRLFKHEMPFEAIGDVLVLAGDSMYLESGKPPCRSFWQWASENFQRVLMIPGNHEFYHSGDVAKYGDSWHNEIFPNVSYHQNEVVRIGDTDFIHLPTFDVVAPRHKSSPISSAFATELKEFIADSGIDLWIYGHSHTNIDTVIGKHQDCQQPAGICFSW